MKIEKFDRNNVEHYRSQSILIKNCKAETVAVESPRTGEVAICPVTSRVVTLNPGKDGRGATCNLLDCPNIAVS